MTLDEIKKALNENICAVSFKKKNGEHRVMLCTVQPNSIPEELRPHGTETYNPNQVRVFDLKKCEWRSFLFENFEDLHVIEM